MSDKGRHRHDIQENIMKPDGNEDENLPTEGTSLKTNKRVNESNELTTSNAQDGEVSNDSIIDNHKSEFRSAMSSVHNVENTAKTTRRSYSREKKLEVISWYKNNGKNKYQTCKKFGIPRKCMATWLKMESEIMNMTEGQLARRGGKVNWPDMEQELYQRFIKAQKNEVKVKKKWFEKEAFEIMTQLYPDVNFKFSAGWFRRFKMRNKIP